MQDGKISKSDKHAGWNTAMKVEIGKFPKITSMKNAFAWKFSKINKCTGWNKGLQVGFFQ